jgi:hypothetical protein
MHFNSATLSFPRQPATDCLADSAVERRPNQHDFDMSVQDPAREHDLEDARQASCLPFGEG